MVMPSKRWPNFARPSNPPPAATPQNPKNNPNEIEFRFVFANEEDHSMFALANGYDIEEVNKNIEADLADNELIFEVKKPKYFISAMLALISNRLLLNIGGLNFNLLPETIKYTIPSTLPGVSKETALVVRVSIMIDPASMSLPT